MSIARGATSLYVSNIVVLVANTVYFLVLTNILRSTMEVGIVTALNIMILLLVTACIMAQPITTQSPVPAPLAVLKFLPESVARGSHGGAVSAFRLSLTVTGIISGSVAVALSVWPSLVIPLLGGQAVLPDFVRLSAFDVLTLSLAQICLGTLIALGDLKGASIYMIVWSIIRYALASILMLRLSIIGVLLGFIIGDGILFLGAFQRSIRGLRGGSGESGLRLEGFFGYSLITLVSALMGFAVNQADKIFALAKQGLAELAIYNVAIVASSLVGSAPFALLTVLVPAFSSLWASNKKNELRNLVRASTRYVSIGVIPLAVGFASLTEVALRIFGPDYVNGFLPSIIVSIATGLTAIGVVYASVLFALNEPRWYTAGNGGGLIGLVAVSALMTPILGLVGPALGRATLLGIGTCIFALAARKKGFLELDLRAFLSATGSSVLMGVLVFGALSIVHSFYLRLALLPFLITFGGFIYLGALRLLRLLTVSDLEFALNISPRSLRRILTWVARFSGIQKQEGL